MKRKSVCLLALSAAALVMATACGPVRLVATTNIPPPLIVKIPVGVALFIPKEFKEYVHKEERWSTDWHVDLGKAQTEGITRLVNAMFERVVPVDSVSAAANVPDIRAILEPSIEEYAFVTPRDAGSPFFAVSIKYRVNVYLPDGRLADSWGFTGYGTSPAQGLSSTEPLARATALALRDAGAKLAVEFREQAIVRGLLPESESIDAPPAAAGASAPLEDSTAQPSEEAASGASGDESEPGGESPQTSAPVAPEEDSATGEAPGSEPPPGPIAAPPAESGDSDDASEDEAGDPPPPEQPQIETFTGT